jgi:hypothetical protein
MSFVKTLLKKATKTNTFEITEGSIKFDIIEND